MKAWQVFLILSVFVFLLGMVLLLGEMNGIAELLLTSYGGMAPIFIIGYYIGKHKQKKEKLNVIGH